MVVDKDKEVKELLKEHPTTECLEAAKRLAQKVGHPDWLAFVAAGKDCIYVMAKLELPYNPIDGREALPTIWEGYPVYLKRNMGPLVPLTGDRSE